MTAEEYKAEYQYRRQERLGIMLDSTREPTKEEESIAKTEAIKAMDKFED